MDGALLREPSVLEQERAEDGPRAEVIPELMAEEADALGEIDAALERDRAVAAAAGVGQGMHASLRRSRPGAGGSGAKAVLADKRAHDLDVDIARRRARASLADRMSQAAYGSHISDVAIPGFDPDGLPTLALYRGGQNAEQLIAVLGGEDAASNASVATVSALLRRAGVPVPLAA
ncbi:hypothetical protein FNF29_00299 [Cafeteria roenbergensis]|uniref:Uncharacterized protein n=1 Tax=Cafeteria roenbergensis TaxID=33653 RepID=A0A5A8CXS5_CAFRO|nr:hypothetical protein FNF29_00299 [Cafeteria roenbergensis]|eukprot:KAA0157725.1 hypothetical protein FNF29_00299 [Cafeteria roenbergensis]